MSGPLPNYIRTFRRKADLSQDELARLLGGGTGSTVLRHEDYQRIPSLEKALRYAAIFDADPREIFAGYYAKERKVIAENARALLEELGEETRSTRKLAFLHMLAEGNDFVYEPCDE